MYFQDPIYSTEYTEMADANATPDAAFPSSVEDMYYHDSSPQSLPEDNSYDPHPESFPADYPDDIYE